MAGLALTTQEQATLTALDPDIDQAASGGLTDQSGNLLVPRMPGYNESASTVATPSDQRPIIRQALEVFLVPLMRVLFQGLGFQQTLYDNFPSTSTPSTSFTDLVTVSFTPPIAKTYEIAVNAKAFYSVGTGTVKFRLVVGGVNIPPPTSAIFTMNSSGQAWPIIFSQVIAFSSTNPTTITLQWLTTAGTVAMNAGTEGLVITVRGA